MEIITDNMQDPITGEAMGRSTLRLVRRVLQDPKIRAAVEQRAEVLRQEAEAREGSHE